jgi:RNase E specificity factor CsrD
MIERKGMRLLPAYYVILLLLAILPVAAIFGADRTPGWPHALAAASSLSAALAIWLLLRRYMAVQCDLQQAHDSLAETSLEINLLMQDAYIPLSQQTGLAERLQLLRQSLLLQKKREQEVRQLVRVQGLVDHELAIGNRIYFESKLQHYLQDLNEPDHGGLFIIQLSHPELVVGVKDAVQRLSGCADLTAQLCAQYPHLVLARVAEADLALLIPGLEQRDAEQLGDRLAMVLSRASFFAGFEDFDLVHLGYVIYQRGQSAYQVMAEADMALKTAQLQGPNAAFGFYPDHKPKIRGSVWWRTELTNALKEQRFMLSFQPVFAGQQGDIIQHEVLVRLNSSDGDQLTAGIFLPMAVNCGLSRQLDQYVLTKAARLVRQEQKNAVRCSLNLSVESLLQPEFLQWLLQEIAQENLTPAQMALEFDEYHLNRQFKKLKSRLEQLRQVGFSLIVDHVGLSISIVDYVSELPLDAVKLHASVVRDIDRQLEQQLYIRGLVAGYQQKGIQVIATGVETAAEWQLLQKLGVTGAQGFYFSQPLAALIPQTQAG